MAIRFFIALLGLCGLGLVLSGILDTLFFSAPSDVYHVIPLSGGLPDVENRVRRALYGLKGKLYFVDLGLDAEAQSGVELLLRNRSYAMLLAPAQLLEELRWENDLGTGADQRHNHDGYLSK